jgi:peptide methionine sulfoxide reductase MsrA
MDIAKNVTLELQNFIDDGKITNYLESKIATKILPASTFFPAEDYHQDYLNKNVGGYCNHAYRFKIWPSSRT